MGRLEAAALLASAAKLKIFLIFFSMVKS